MTLKGALAERLAYAANATKTLINVRARAVSDGPVQLPATERRKNRLRDTHLSRVAVLGQLSGTLVHELQQPLTSILCNARAAQRLLAHEQWSEQALGEILTDIVTANKRAAEIIKRMRALMVRGETQFQAVEVGDLMHDVLAITRNTLIERHVQVYAEIKDSIPPVRGDLVELEQVLLNLLLNACESMSSNSPTDRLITVDAAVNKIDGTVCFSVLDRGSGIDKANLERIFEPFFTTKDSGMGLGLAICRSIIVAHHGRLWATNRSDRGSAFHFTIPVAAKVESHEHSNA
jgi:C4-dicarboxylate-specific signal transduction histidine kinase